MSNEKLDSLQVTKSAFSSIEALVKDAHGNAIGLAFERERLNIGAQYLRLAGRKCAALSELIDAIADGDRRRGEKAIKRIAEIDRDIEKHLDAVAVANTRLSEKHGAVRMTVSGEDLQKLMQGEPPPELVAKLKQVQKEQESA